MTRRNPIASKSASVDPPSSTGNRSGDDQSSETPRGSDETRSQRDEGAENETPVGRTQGVRGDVGEDQIANDETADLVPGGKHFRCVCGTDVSIHHQMCPDCSRPIHLGSLDASMTAAVLTGSGDSSGSARIRAGAGAVLTGRRIGHFELRERIGSGGMGDVYRALDTSLQRFVAVKVLRQTEGGSRGGGEAIEHLLTEAVAQARLNHPNAVTIYFVGHDEENPFLAMELLSGPTVRERISQGPLAFDEIVVIARQVVSALTQADAMGMTHSDVKPGNLLYCGPRQVKLGDFGLTHIRNADGKGPTVVSGTPNYLAPELLDGVAPNLKSDLYSLGVTLFEMTFGRRPFELVGSTLGEKLETHRTAKVEFPERWPSDLPDAWRDVLQKLLSKKPADRYDSYQELEFDLATLMPLSAVAGGRLQRGLAFIFDQTVLAIGTAPALMLSVLSETNVSIADLAGSSGGSENGVIDQTFSIVVTSLSAVLGVLPIALFVWMEVRTRRTPGRYLLQMDVVDRLGYPIRRGRMFQRSLLRNSFFIGFGLQFPFDFFGLYVLFPFLITGGFLVTVVSSFMLLLPNVQTLHDWLTRTRVVLRAG